MLHDLIMVPSKNNSFSPDNIKNIFVAVSKKIEEDLGVCKMQIQKTMQNK